jgi:hypothetical protein
LTEITPEQFYQVAVKLCDASKALETDLKTLDGKLDVAQSAGTYATGGPTWATSYDQSASDIFELGSLASIAARELGYQVHQAGLNHAKAENESNGGADDQPVPPAPQGSVLSTNLHPTEHAVGGTHEVPEHWDLIADYVTKQWADCDEGRIASAGSAFTDFGPGRTTNATTLWSEVTSVFTAAAQDQSPEIDGIVDEVANVCRAIADTGDAATYLGSACAEVNRVATIDKRTGRTSLQILNVIIASYEIDRIATYRLPFGDMLRQLIDQMIETNKRAYAEGMDRLIEGINGTVGTAAKSNEGIYAMATGTGQLLASILDRTPRQTNPVRNRTEAQNREAGAEAERRAGIPDEPQTAVDVVIDGRKVTVIPDYIDTENQNVVEVKDTNEIRPYSQQIRAEAEYAASHGYTMTLVIDHRTQINDPQVQALVDSGKIQVVRKELDDNNDT